MKEEAKIVAPAGGGSRAVVDRLAARITQCLARHDPAGLPFALLDFPDHPNVGDSAIWAGEIAFFERIWGKKPAFAASNRVNWDDLERLVPEGPIFIHGGGNFGDVWPAHQQFRETLLDRYPGRPILQMPQSLHFSDEAAIARCARAIERHGALTLLVRDQESFDLARARFDCEVELCPDMAFCMGPLPRPIASRYPLLFLLRTDHETVLGGKALPALPPGAQVDDWLTEPADSRDRAASRARRNSLFRLGTGGSARRALDYCNLLAQARIDRGLRMLSAADHVVTDRLHAHILCTLLDIPHQILDNHYGKISRYVASWQTAWDGVGIAGSLEDAISRVA